MPALCTTKEGMGDGGGGHIGAQIGRAVVVDSGDATFLAPLSSFSYKANSDDNSAREWSSARANIPISSFRSSRGSSCRRRVRKLFKQVEHFSILRPPPPPPPPPPPSQQKQQFTVRNCHPGNVCARRDCTASTPIARRKQLREHTSPHEIGPLLGHLEIIECS